MSVLSLSSPAQRELRPGARQAAERIGEVILDIAFRVTLPAEAEMQAFAGEYVFIAREESGGIRVHRIVTFPPREAPMPR